MVCLGGRLFFFFYRYLVFEGLVRLSSPRDFQTFSGDQRLEYRLPRAHFVVGFRSPEDGNLALVASKQNHIANPFLSQFGHTGSSVLYLV